MPVLDATPAGAKVYMPLGFQEAWGFSRLAATQTNIKPPPTSIAVRPIDDCVWPALCAYDAGVFGADRSKIIARMRGRLPPANLYARA